MNFFKEIKNLYRLLFKTPEENKRIIFYTEHGGYYPNFEGLLDELTGNHGLTISYITSDPNDPILSSSHERIKSFYLKSLLPYYMQGVDCSVFVMTLTDLHQFYLRRSINPVHYVYVFHAMVSTHMMYLAGAFDHYDSILCVGPHQIEEIRKYEAWNNFPEKKLINAGYYRLEKIFEEYKKYSAKKTDKSKQTILIAPSWGEKNILESVGDSLIELLLGNDYEVIVRPHPEIVKRSFGLVKGFAEKFGHSSAFVLETSIATNDSFLKADVLISDCSGVSLEYAFGTERPVLFIDVPYKIRNPNFRELDIEPVELALRSKLGIVVDPEAMHTVPQKLKKLLDNRIKYKKQISELRKQYVFAFGKSSEIGARHIANLISHKPEHE